MADNDDGQYVSQFFSHSVTVIQYNLDTGRGSNEWGGALYLLFSFVSYRLRANQAVVK